MIQQDETARYTSFSATNYSTYYAEADEADTNNDLMSLNLERLREKLDNPFGESSCIEWRLHHASCRHSIHLQHTCHVGSIYRPSVRNRAGEFPTSQPFAADPLFEGLAIASPHVRIERRTVLVAEVDEEAVRRVLRLAGEEKQTRWRQFAATIHTRSPAGTCIPPMSCCWQQPMPWRMPP